MSKRVGEKIRYMRIRLSKSQKEIASLLGISVAAYFKIEANKTDINISRLNQIANLFNVSPASLLLYEEPDGNGSKEIAELKSKLHECQQQVLELQNKLLVLYERTG